MVVTRQGELAQVVLTFRPARSLAGRLHGRQEQRHKHPNDGDNHEQLDQGEAMGSRVALSRKAPLAKAGHRESS
jgi:hypothetical protein